MPLLLQKIETMNIRQINYQREIALNTNYHKISRWIEEDPELSKYDNHDFIEAAAKWNYRQYGFGFVSLDKYLQSLEKKRSGRLYNTDVKLWYKIIKDVFKRDNYTCQYCGQIGGKLECDHIHPQSKGGTNDLGNLITACRKCNRQKKDKSVQEFLEWRSKR